MTLTDLTLHSLTGIPGKPGTPDIVDWDVDRVDLKWDPPKDTGGAPITKYIIEKKERYGSWEPIHESEVRHGTSHHLYFFSTPQY